MKGTLNLHAGFASNAANVINYKTSMFPGGEVYVKVDIPDWCSSVRINSRCNNSDDLMRIILAADAIRRAGIEQIGLFIPYLPYSRQDRVCEKGESFSLKAVCALLLNCCFNSIHTYDNHSNVAEVLLDNLHNHNNHNEVDAFMKRHALNDVILIAPDAGASKKAQALCKGDDRIVKVVQCTKSRVGGKIIIDTIKENIRGKVVLVVDDICDGGRTFVELADRLEEAQVHKSYLFVSHGIFSSGFDELKRHYSGIGTTNSIREKTDPMDCITFPIIY